MLRGKTRQHLGDNSCIESVTFPPLFGLTEGIQTVLVRSSLPPPPLLPPSPTVPTGRSSQDCQTIRRLVTKREQSTTGPYGHTIYLLPEVSREECDFLSRVYQDRSKDRVG